MAETVAGMFLEVVARHGGRPAFRHRVGETLVTYTYGSWPSASRRSRPR